MSTKTSGKKTTQSKTGRQGKSVTVNDQNNASDFSSVWQSDLSQICSWSQVWSSCGSPPLVWNRKQSLKSHPQYQQVSDWIKLLKKQDSDLLSKEKSLQTIQQILEFIGQTVESLPRLLSQPIRESSSTIDPDSEEAKIAREIDSIGLGVLCAAWLVPLLKNQVDGRHLETCRHALLALSNADIGFAHQPVLQQRLRVELPLVMNLHFPSDITVCELWPQMESDLADAMEEALDGNGIPSPHFLPIFGDLVATWTRVMGMSIFLERPIFDPEPEIHFQWTVRQFLRLLRSDKRLLGSDGENKISDDFCLAALTASDDEEDWEFSKTLLPKLVNQFPKDRKKKYISKKGKDNEPLIHASDGSEWCKIGILRSDWKPKSDKILVDYSGKENVLRIENSKDWIAGPIGTSITRAGKPISLSDNWTEVCWDTDDYYSYLEIQNESKDGKYVVQRQFLLSLDYRFLYIGDFVSGPKSRSKTNPTELGHQFSFQSANGCQTISEKENTEANIQCGKDRLNILPLCLPEWRTESARGNLQTRADGFDLSYNLPSNKLYNAVLFDLDKKRCKSPYTWRRLMVGQSLDPVSLDRAVGFRAQLDRLQFLFYRNLGEITSQTVLGQNYYCDFFAGYFTPGGTCDEIVMINGHVEEEDE